MIYLIYIDIFIIYLLLSNILPMKLTSPAEAIVDTPPASSRVISGLTAGVYCIQYLLCLGIQILRKSIKINTQLDDFIQAIRPNGFSGLENVVSNTIL